MVAATAAQHGIFQRSPQSGQGFTRVQQLRLASRQQRDIAADFGSNA